MLSHHGEINKKQIGKLLVEFRNDAYKDFSKDYSEEVSKLSKKQLKALKRIMNK